MTVGERGRRAGVAALCGALALALGLAYAPGSAAGRYAPLSAAWVAMAAGLALEPRPGQRVLRTLLAAAAAALLGAVVALVLATRSPPPWWPPGERPALGLSLACAAWTGRAAPSALLLAVATLPAPLALLLVRRLARQLEWQVAGAALGPAVVGATLFHELAAPDPLWVLALTGLPLGVGAYLVDRARLGAAGVASFPEAEPSGEASPDLRRFRAVLLGLLLVSGLAWPLVARAALRPLVPAAVEPGAPDVRALLEDVRARQAAHHERHREFARVLGELEGIDPELAGGYVHGHVVRYGRFSAGSYGLAADPVPARLGWPSYRLIVPRGEVEVGEAPFPLERP